MKIQKQKNLGGGVRLGGVGFGGGFKVDVNGEVKLFCENSKKNFFFFFGGGGSGWM